MSYEISSDDKVLVAHGKICGTTVFDWEYHNTWQGFILIGYRCPVCSEAIVLDLNGKRYNAAPPTDLA